MACTEWGLGMVVYVEVAFLQNFIIDGILLYLALKTVRAPVRIWALLCASLVGAIEAILFPLIRLSLWASLFVKLLGGILICLIAVCKGSFGTHFKVTVCFFCYTFLYGGALTALYSYLQIAYEEGNGYLVESAPVSLVLSVAILFAFVCARGIKGLYAFRQLQRATLTCTLIHGEKWVKWQAIGDSGNLLFFRGEPVSVISPVGALALFGEKGDRVGHIRLKTVNGESVVPVLRCDELRFDHTVRKNVLFAVADVRVKGYQLILHTALTEGIYGNCGCAQGAVAKDKGK